MLQNQKGFLVFFVSILIIACNEKNDNSKSTSDNNFISLVRSNPSSKPVARYIVPMGDPKLERKFGVEVFETTHTFKYLLSMQYDGTLEQDTLRLPELNTMPTVIVKPGNDKLSCIIGFLDDKKVFREYKLLSVKNNQLSLSVLRRYAME